MKNILVSISYDGSAFHGWQIQKNAVTVQEEFQKALYKVIGERVDIKGSSRTDSGVHAYEYCISFKTTHSIPPERLVAALNTYLPKTIAAKKACYVSEDFHARYSSLGKEYVYKIYNAKIRDPFLEGYALHYWYPLDEKVLDKAAKDFIGYHDFTSFCTLDSREIGDFRRTVRNASVTRDGDMVYFTVEADGFLYNMVRIMVGTLLRIAQGKFPPDSIPEIIQAKDRHKAGPTAPPEGLYLNQVIYEAVCDCTGQDVAEYLRSQDT